MHTQICHWIRCSQQGSYWYGCWGWSWIPVQGCQGQGGGGKLQSDCVCMCVFVGSCYGKPTDSDIMCKRQCFFEGAPPSVCTSLFGLMHRARLLGVRPTKIQPIGGTRAQDSVAGIDQPQHWLQLCLICTDVPIAQYLVLNCCNTEYVVIRHRLGDQLD